MSRKTSGVFDWEIEYEHFICSYPNYMNNILKMFTFSHLRSFLEGDLSEL